ncbi:hypothetical protein [Pedobacter sp. Hv1]|uniref:hypothetical protein n=1 Tax=Pedobacter sp. Hv1 TaxID=1740090 RepID=UPI0006D89A21|nr:hypothetical protein [Pedobacter sp. Hv1]KQC00839.1 hypothetical protein AQF98_09170 [Pedobacter sp. Hv1]
MRAPNYKVGWILETKVAALTHFHSEITHEDMIGVFTETQKLLMDTKGPFQIIIDNRLAPLNKLFSLEELQNSSPLLLHPFLDHIVIVKPNHLELRINETPIEKRKSTYLKNVSSIQEALNFLRQAIPELSQAKMDSHFFDNN